MKQKTLYQESYYPPCRDGSYLSVCVVKANIMGCGVIITRVEAAYDGVEISLKAAGYKELLIEMDDVAESRYIRQAIALYDKCEKEYKKLLEEA